MATPLLGLALPTTGSLAGAWGNTVNNSITSLLDSAIAGTTTLSADVDVTLTTTVEAANQAREAIILWTASGTTTRNITAPAQSKTYVVINASGTQSIVLRGVGPTTGVTISAGEKAFCVWNGSDFVKVSSSSAGTVTSVTATAPVVSTGGATPVISMPAASGSSNGYLTSTNWTTFNAKQGALTLTTTGTSGAATLIGTTLNIPQYAGGGGGGTVTSVSVTSGNGFAGTVATATSTPAITLSTTITGVLKGNGTAINAATAGTDYLAPPSGTSILKAASGGALANAVAGTDYQAPITLTTTGTSGAATFVGNTLNIPQYSGGSGTVTSVSGTGTVSGLTLSGTVTTSGSLTLGGAITGTGSGSVVLATSPTITTPVISGNTSVNSQFLGTRGSGTNNVAFGSSAGGAITTGSSNTAMGASALSGQTTNDGGTAFGYQALSGTSYDNSAGFGALTAVTGANQVQLGSSITTTYVYGTVQNRSDLRDKAEIRDTQLGLSFVNALRPVDYKLDMRDDYKPPMPDPEDEVAMAAWREAAKMANLTHDGSKKRSRFHHGLIAQEVKAVLDAQGIDFGGYQDHKVTGGDDVLSIGYDELIAPLIKAIQELTARVQQLEAKNG